MSEAGKGKVARSKTSAQNGQNGGLAVNSRRSGRFGGCSLTPVRMRAMWPVSGSLRHRNVVVVHSFPVAAVARFGTLALSSSSSKVIVGIGGDATRWPILAVMSGWNFANVWEVVAEVRPDAPAVSQGDRQYTWADFDRRADGVTSALLELGATQQASVAQYLYNCPEYLESVFATFKAGLVPVNTNYRYADDELVYIWDNADVAIVVFHDTFTERVERIRSQVPRVHGWLWVDD